MMGNKKKIDRYTYEMNFYCCKFSKFLKNDKMLETKNKVDGKL